MSLFQPYMLLFARFTAILTTTLGFGDTHIPQRFRLLFALGLAFLLKDSLLMPQESLSEMIFLSLLFQEILVGVFIGVLGRLILSALDIVGNIVSLQIGFGNAVVFNPSIGGQSPITSNFLVLSGLFLFFITDMHFFVIHSLLSSYKTFPIDPSFSHFPYFSESVPFLLKFFSKILIFACQLALPFLILGVIFQFILGLLNRLVQNIQIFFIMLPAQILLGLLLMSMTFVTILSIFIQSFPDLYQSFPGFKDSQIQDFKIKG